MATEIWVNIGSGNGLLPDGTKPLPEVRTNVDLPSVRSIGIHLSTISQEILQPSITKISWKIAFLKFLLNLPGANELRVKYQWLLGVLMTFCLALVTESCMFRVIEFCLASIVSVSVTSAHRNCWSPFENKCLKNKENIYQLGPFLNSVANNVVPFLSR